MLHPEFPISVWEAFGRRFRRNYVWIFFILGLAWALKSYLHPTPAATWAEFLAHSTLGPIPGWLMLTIGLVYNGLLFLIGYATAGLTQASGEVLPKFGEFPVLSGLWHAMETRQAGAGGGLRDRLTSYTRRRQQLLALIISSKPCDQEAVEVRVTLDEREVGIDGGPQQLLRR